MTKQKAKEITIEVWDYLSEHGEIEYKGDLPLWLNIKVSNCLHQCPLCQLFNDSRMVADQEPWHLNCLGCPLKEAGQQCYSKRDGYFTIWDDDDSSDEQRAQAAKGIADIVREWEIDEEVIEGEE